jgi:TipAS antibiotic-recognition domain
LDLLDDGRDGEVPSVERYFQTHPPSGERPEDWHAEDNLRLPGSAQRDVAQLVSQIYGREIHLEPGSQTVDDLLRAAGSESMGASYAEVGDMVRYLGPGSSAIVASTLSDGIASPVLDDGSIIFLAANIGGEVRFYDLNWDVLGNWPPPWGEDDVSSTAAGYLDANGDPVLPFGELNDRRLTVRSLMDEALARLSGADELRLSSDIWALNEGFGTAMAGNVAPGSEQTNALAQRHFDIARRLFADYNYESHRADGHWLLMVEALRDPYEWLAPGLARYVRDVIVANADYHLGPPR